MTTRKRVGKLDSWDDGDVESGSIFMAIEEGSNIVRVVTSPYQFYVHWVDDASKKRRKIKCAEDGCPCCEGGDKASARWYLGVLKRKTNTPAIIEVGPQIFSQISDLNKDPSWGNPREYDINIKRKPKGSQPLYNITPNRPLELSRSEKEMINEFMSKIDFVELTRPSTIEEICEKLGIEKRLKVDDFGDEEEQVDPNFDDVLGDSVDEDDDIPF